MTYYAIVGSTGLFGLLLIIIMRHNWYGLEIYHDCINLDQSNMYLHLGCKCDFSDYTAVEQKATINSLEIYPIPSHFLKYLLTNILFLVFSPFFNLCLEKGSFEFLFHFRNLNYCLLAGFTVSWALPWHAQIPLA